MVPPMPLDAFVKEEVPADAILKEEGMVPPMPLDAFVKEEVVITKEEENADELDSDGLKRRLEGLKAPDHEE